MNWKDLNMLKDQKFNVIYICAKHKYKFQMKKIIYRGDCYVVQTENAKQFTIETIIHQDPC